MVIGMFIKHIDGGDAGGGGGEGGGFNYIEFELH